MFYQHNDYQHQLLSSPIISIDTLSLIQRKTITRLQFIVHNKINFIKSTDNELPHLRIIILAVLVKIYESFSVENQRRLEIIKSIIYSAKLDKMIKDYGVLREQLGKVIAVQFKRMQVGFQAESYLLNMFNCVPFFDQIILMAFHQHLLAILLPLDCSPQHLQKLYQTFEQLFHIKIIWNKQLSDSQHPNQIYLWRIRQQIMIQSSLNMTFIGQSSSQESGQEWGSRSSFKRKIKQKSKTIMLQTVSIGGDSKFESTFNREKQQEQQAVQGFHYSKSKDGRQNINKSKQTTFCQVHLVKRQQPKRTLWDILCCSHQ